MSEDFRKFAARALDEAQRPADEPMDSVEASRSVTSASNRAKAPQTTPEAAPASKTNAFQAFALSALNSAAQGMGPRVLAAEDGMDSVLGPRPSQPLQSPMDVLSRAGSNMSRGVQFLGRMAHDPGETLSTLKAGYDQALPKYQGDFSSMGMDHPVASTLGSLAGGLAAGPKNIAQAGVSGMLQGIGNSRDLTNPTEVLGNAAQGGVMGSAGFVAPVATGAALVGYGAAAQDLSPEERLSYMLQGGFSAGLGLAGRLAPKARELLARVERQKQIEAVVHPGVPVHLQDPFALPEEVQAIRDHVTQAPDRLDTQEFQPFLEPTEMSGRRNSIEGQINEMAPRRPTLPETNAEILSSQKSVSPTGGTKEMRVTPPSPVDKLPSVLPEDRPTIESNFGDVAARALKEGAGPKAGPGGASDEGGTGGPVRPAPPTLADKVASAYQNDPRSIETPAGRPAGPLPETAPVDEEVKHAVDLHRQLIKNQNPGFLEKLKRGAILPEFRTFSEAAAAIRGWKAARNIREVTMGRIFPQLREEYSRLGPSSKNIVDQFTRQNLSPEDLRSGRLGDKIPLEALETVAPGWASLFRQSRDVMNSFTADLAKAGYFSQEALGRMTDRMDQNVYWLTRDYAKFLDKGFMPDQALHTRAVEWMMKHHDLDPNAAVAALHDMTFSEKGGPPETRWREYQQNKGILKQRENIPGIIRDFLGEIHNPSFVVAASHAELEGLWHQHQISKAFTDPQYEGVLWSKTPDPAKFALDKVWNESLSPEENKRTYGEFSGKYVAPSLYESIMQGMGPQTRNLVQDAGSTIMSLFKTAKIGFNHKAYINNFVGNAQYAAQAGLPLWSPMLYKRMGQAARALHGFNESFTTPEGSPLHEADARWARWAYEDHALGGGGTGKDFGGSTAKAIYRRYVREGGEMQGVRGLLKSLWGTVEEGKAKLGESYDAIDKYWRLATYIHQVTQGVKVLDLPLNTARSRASQIVNENFASASQVGEGTERVAQMTGLVAPMMRFHADNLRVHANLAYQAGKAFMSKDPLPGQGVQRIFSGEGAAPALQAALHRLLVIGGVGTFLRYATGSTDAEHAAAEASLKPSTAKYMPARDYWGFRDSRGRMQIFNLSPLLPMYNFVSGDPRQNFLSRVGTGIVKGFTDSGAAEYPVNKALQAFGMMAPGGDPPEPPAPFYKKALEQAWNVVEPGSSYTLREAARRAGAFGPTRRTEEQYTPGQALARILSPVTAEPVGEKSYRGAQVQELGVQREAVKASSMVKKATDLTLGEKKDLVRKMKGNQREVMDRRRQRVQDRGGAK